MAFGNATIGDLKKHAGGGGGGGGTKDYSQLTNKPSINGVELLGDINIGQLSGDIKVTLSALENVSLTSPTNAQTLLFNALTGKWENNTPSTGISFVDKISDISTGIPLSDINAGLLLVATDSSSRRISGIFTKADIINNAEYVFGYSSEYSNNKFVVADDTLTITKVGGRDLIHVYIF